MTVNDYHIDLFYSAEDECWVANVPDLRYCSAFGDTPAEAAQEIMIALEGWLEVAEEEGKPIPPPSHRPATATG
jgi:predicted RNase H-like HicB family nuclease